jgi:hypothetical protein
MKPVPTSGRGYPVNLVTSVRRYADAGWSIAQLLDFIEREHGFRPHQSTISRWLDPAQRARDARTNERRAARRRAEETGGRHLRAGQTPEFKIARVQALRRGRLSFDAIAVVMSLDYEAINGEQIRHALAVGHYPKSISAAPVDAREDDADVQRWITDEVLAA